MYYDLKSCRLVKSYYVLPKSRRAVEIHTFCSVGFDVPLRTTLVSVILFEIARELRKVVLKLRPQLAPGMCAKASDFTIPTDLASEFQKSRRKHKKPQKSFRFSDFQAFR